MAETQHGWTKLLTRTGRYEIQFQGRGPAVRGGMYEEAQDYTFLILDEEGWLYRVPVRVSAEAEAAIATLSIEVLRVAEARLRAGLDAFRPRQGAPYEELDVHFAVDAVTARELVSTLK